MNGSGLRTYWSVPYRTCRRGAVWPSHKRHEQRDDVLGESVGTRVNAFINVQLPVYFLAVCVNGVELRPGDTFYISEHTYEMFHTGDRRRPDGLDWVCSRPLMGWIRFKCFNTTHLCFSTCVLFFFFFALLNLAKSLLARACRSSRPPIRVEYKLYQSAAATAACDKSLSDTLMPSNCL